MIKYLFISLFCLQAIVARADVYVILYATLDGYTGHSAIAIEAYDIAISDSMHEGKKVFYEDTISNGKVHYFDLWTTQKSFRFPYLNKDYDALYHAYPSLGQSFSIQELFYKGLPDGMIARRFDGLIKIKSSKAQDFRLISKLREKVAENKAYNLFSYNCSDFVIDALEIMDQRKIRAREFFIYRLSNTPNKLFRKLSKMEGSKVILDPKKKAKGNFIVHRILKKPQN